MRVMTGPAGHPPFGNLVVVRKVKLGNFFLMAGKTEFLRTLSDEFGQRLARMHRVTGETGIPGLVVFFSFERHEEMISLMAGKTDGGTLSR